MSITFTNKEDSRIIDVPAKNKIVASDVNALKDGINTNETEIVAAKTAVATSLNDNNLIVAKETNLQAYAESADDALLIARSTGVSTTYTSTVSVGGTTFNQGAVSGEISSDEGYFRIVYAGATNITVTNLAAISTFVFIDKTGTLGQQSTEPTREDRTRKIFVMRIGVNTVSNQIIGFEYENNPIGHYANSIRDVYEFLLAQGVPFKKDQLVTGRNTDLGFDVSSGSLLEFGGTGNIYNPNIKNFNSVSNTSYNLLNRTTIVSSETDLVKFWDNNGTITALGSTTLVGHRLFRFSNGNFAIQYGQGNYANMSLAKTNAPLEEYVLNPALKDATFFGWWFIESTATNTGGTTLTDFKEYTLGASGGSSNSLSGALLKGNNLSDLLDAAAARTNLGVTALDNANVKLTGNQTIADTKAFTGLITMSDRLELNDSLDNTFIGEDSGITNTTGGANVSAGYNALNSNTTGSQNVAIGYTSLEENTGGNYNTAVGLQSLKLNTTGDFNLAVGYQSLSKNISGVYNTALGHNSLYHNTTGFYNLGIGSNSGKYIADGTNANQTGNNSIFIGRDTRANADGETNQIVIGNIAVGNGSNTVTLGNNNITDTYLKGVVKITDRLELSDANENSFIGDDSGVSNTTGANNIALGKSSLEVNNTGNGNIAVGRTSLSDNTGSFNTALGHKSLFTNTTGDNNVALGLNSGSYIADGLTSNLTGYGSVFLGWNTKANANGETNQIVIGSTAVGNGSNTVTLGNDNITDTYLKGVVNILNRLDLNDSLNNTFIGKDAGIANTTGNNNVASGYQSLYNNIGGDNNIASGYQILYHNTTGNDNIASGYRSLFYNIGGGGNIASGHQSLYYNTTGSNNVASGFQSLHNNIGGGNNIASGYQSMFKNTNGNNNVSSGHQSLFENTTGYNNVASGYNAGKNTIAGFNQTGSNSIFIGANTEANADGETNQIVIGDIAIGKGSNSVTLGNDSITDTYLKGDVELSENISLFDNKEIILGNGNDLRMYHTGSDSYLQNSSGKLVILNSADDINLQSFGGINLYVNQNNIGMSLFAGGRVDLRYNNVTKIRTESSGAKILGDLTVNGSGEFDSSVTATDGNFSGDLDLISTSPTLNIEADNSNNATIILSENNNGQGGFIRNTGGSNRFDIGVNYGGTETNALSFTYTNGSDNAAATFASSVGIGGTATAPLHVFGGGILGSSSTNPIAFTGSSGSNAGIGSYNANTDFNIYAAGSGATKFQMGAAWNNNGTLTNVGTTALTLNSDQSATFASSVSATDGNFSGNLLINASSTIGSARIMLEIGSGENGYTTKPKTDSDYLAAVFRANSGSAIGAITCDSTSTGYITASDYRLKEDLKDFNGLEMISNIPVYDYKWKVNQSRSYGVMAHELQEVLPYAVSEEKDAEEMQGVDYSKIVPLLIKSIQELTAKVEMLEANK